MTLSIVFSVASYFTSACGLCATSLNPTHSICWRNLLRIVSDESEPPYLLSKSVTNLIPFTSFDIPYQISVSYNNCRGVYFRYRDAINNLHATRILIRLGLNFNQVGTNNVMTHVMVLSAKVKRNERFKWVVMSDFKHYKSISRNRITQRKIQSS